MIETEAQEVASAECTDPPEKRRRQETKGLMSLLEDVIDIRVEDETTSMDGKAKNEIQKYLCLDATADNPLKSWLENNKHFPLLGRVAKKYLCTSATSVPSERAFSVAGYIVNEKRACLLPENVNMLVFLSEILISLRFFCIVLSYNVSY